LDTPVEKQIGPAHLGELGLVHEKRRENNVSSPSHAVYSLLQSRWLPVPSEHPPEEAHDFVQAGPAPS